MEVSTTTPTLQQVPRHAASPLITRARNATTGNPRTSAHAAAVPATYEATPDGLRRAMDLSRQPYGMPDPARIDDRFIMASCNAMNINSRHPDPWYNANCQWYLVAEVGPLGMFVNPTWVTPNHAQYGLTRNKTVHWAFECFCLGISRMWLPCVIEDSGRQQTDHEAMGFTMVHPRVPTISRAIALWGREELARTLSSALAKVALLARPSTDSFAQSLNTAPDKLSLKTSLLPGRIVGAMGSIGQKTVLIVYSGVREYCLQKSRRSDPALLTNFLQNALFRCGIKSRLCKPDRVRSTTSSIAFVITLDCPTSPSDSTMKTLYDYLEARGMGADVRGLVGLQWRNERVTCDPCDPVDQAHIQSQGTIFRFPVTQSPPTPSNTVQPSAAVPTSIIVPAKTSKTNEAGITSGTEPPLKRRKIQHVSTTSAAPLSLPTPMSPCRTEATPPTPTIIAQAETPAPNMKDIALVPSEPMSAAERAKTRKRTVRSQVPTKVPDTDRCQKSAIPPERQAPNEPVSSEPPAAQQEQAKRGATQLAGATPETATPAVPRVPSQKRSELRFELLTQKRQLEKAQRDLDTMATTLKEAKAAAVAAQRDAEVKTDQATKVSGQLEAALRKQQELERDLEALKADATTKQEEWDAQETVLNSLADGRQKELQRLIESNDDLQVQLAESQGRLVKLRRQMVDDGWGWAERERTAMVKEGAEDTAKALAKEVKLRKMAEDAETGLREELRKRDRENAQLRVEIERLKEERSKGQLP